MCRRREAFDLVASETIHMSDFSLRDNVGLIVVLRVRSQGSTGSAGIQEMPLVAIANTHLIFNPKRGDIKVKFSTEKLKKFIHSPGTFTI